MKVGESCIEFHILLRDNISTRKKSKPRETWRRKVMGLKSNVIFFDQDRQTTENSKTGRKTVTQSQVSKPSNISKTSSQDRPANRKAKLRESQ